VCKNFGRKKHNMCKRRHKTFCSKVCSERNMPPKKKIKTDGEKENTVVWTDDEIQLLLETVRDFKSEQAYESIDWESIKTKYEKITENFVKNLPKEKTSEYPHIPDQFTKDKISSKIKAVRGKYRKALDSGRKSGGGRVVSFFYDLCSEIWSGSPATQSMASGVESQDSNVNETDQVDGCNELPPEVEEEDIEIENESNEAQEVVYDKDAQSTARSISNDQHSSDTTKATEPIQENESTKPMSSRQEMKNMLENRRDKKITKRLKTESDDSIFRNNLLQRMQDQDKIFNKQVDDLQQNMKQLTNTMTNTFNLMVQMFTPPPAPSTERSANQAPTHMTVPPNVHHYQTPWNAQQYQIPQNMQQYQRPPNDQYQTAIGSPDLSSTPRPGSSFSGTSNDESPVQGRW